MARNQGLVELRKYCLQEAIQLNSDLVRTGAGAMEPSAVVAAAKTFEDYVQSND